MGGTQHRGVNSEHGIFRLRGGAWGGRDVGDEPCRGRLALRFL